MSKLEITIEGPRIEIKIDGVKQNKIAILKMDALIIEGILIGYKSLIYPMNTPEIKEDPQKETNDQTFNRA